MALGRAFSVAVRGLDGEIVEIEADITAGLPGFHLVGLPDAAVQESRDRVRAAITNCGNTWPMSRLTVALSPATLPKTGSLYDIALATAVLSASRKKPWHRLEKTVLLGELALDGRIRPGPRCATRCAGCQEPRLAGRGGASRQPGRGQPGRWHRSARGAHPASPPELAGDRHGTRWTARRSAAPRRRRSRPRRHRRDRPRHGSPSRWPPPGPTTSCSPARLESGKPCSPNASPACSLTSPTPKPSRSRRSTRWRACSANACR